MKSPKLKHWNSKVTFQTCASAEFMWHIIFEMTWMSSSNPKRGKKVQLNPPLTDNAWGPSKSPSQGRVKWCHYFEGLNANYFTSLERCKIVGYIPLYIFWIIFFCDIELNLKPCTC